MKIALLTSQLQPTSIFHDSALFTLAHARALVAAGHHVDLFSSEPGEAPAGRVICFEQLSPFVKLAGKFDQLGYPTLHKELLSGARLFESLRRELRQTDYDMVEVIWEKGEGFFLSQLSTIPFIARFPCFGPTNGQPPGTMDRFLANMVEQAGLEGIRGVSVGSRCLETRVREDLGLACLSRVIYPGLVVEDFQPSTARRVNSPERFRLLMPICGPGDWTRKLLADVIPGMGRRYPCFSLHLAGVGIDDRELETIADQLARRGMERRRLKLTSNPDPGQLPELVLGADALLLPTLEWGGYYVLLAAMAARCPVVVGPIEGLFEFVRAEVDGSVISEGDTGGCEWALERLIREPGFSQQRGRNGLERVKQRFSADQQVIASTRFAVNVFDSVAEAPGAQDPDRPTQVLGPDNWFSAWWLVEGEPANPILAVDEDEKPLINGLSLTEVLFIHGVLQRAWNTRKAESDLPEAVFLDQIHRLFREKSKALEEGEAATAKHHLCLPPLTDALFSSEFAAFFVAESWRIEQDEFFREWLDNEVGTPWFLTTGIGQVELRELVVRMAAQFPSPALFTALNKVYRRAETRAWLVTEDNEWLAADSAGKDFKENLTRLGLHAELERLQVAKCFATTRGEALSTEGLPVVTVLIPSYNHEAYIDRTIRSALAQTQANLKVLVVDDCSADDTVAVAEKISDPRLRVEKNPQNMGLGRSIKKALQKVDTPYLALLNSDDLFHPERIAQCLHRLAGQSEAAVAVTDMFLVDNGDQVLQARNSCLVELGPMVHDLVLWYENEIRNPGKKLDRISLKGLLDQNHLLTSSNLVCTTEFWREHVSLIEPLDYTVDWLLFLEAARTGRLLFIDRQLLAYRLHEKNTMWFSEAARPRYVLEVNRLLAGVFGRLVEEKIVNKKRLDWLVGLLKDHIAKHYETGGWIFFLTSLGLPRPGNKLPDIVREMAKGVRDANLVREILLAEGIQADQLGRLLWEASQYSEARKLADAYHWEVENYKWKVSWLESGKEGNKHWAEDEVAQRERLQGELKSDRAELAGERTKVTDLEQQMREAWEVRGQLEQICDQLRDDMHSLEQTRDQLQNDKHNLEQTRDQLQDDKHSLEQTRDQLQNDKHSLEQTRDQLQNDKHSLEQTRDQLQDDKHSLEQTRDQLQDDKHSLEQTRDQLQDDKHSLEQTRDQLQDDKENLRSALALKQAELARERGDRVREAGEHADWTAELHRRHRREVAGLQESYAGRLGHYLINRLGMGAIVRFSARSLFWYRDFRTRFSGRLEAELRKFRNLPGPIAMAAGRDFPSGSEMSMAGEVQLLLDNGLEASVYCWGRNKSGESDGGYRAPWKKCRVLQHSPALNQRDIEFFRERRPEQVKRLLYYHLEQKAPRAFTFTRNMKMARPAIAMGFGLGDSSWEAYAAGILEWIPFVLQLTAGDILKLKHEPEKWLPLFDGVDLIALETGAIAPILRELLGKGLPEMIVRPPALPPLKVLPDQSAESESGPFRVAVIGPALPGHGLRKLVGALNLAIRQGGDLLVEYLGWPEPTEASQEFWDILRGQVHRLGLDDRFCFIGKLTPGKIASLLSRANLVIEPGYPELGEVELLPIGAALQAGRPVWAQTCERLVPLAGKSSGLSLIDLDSPADISERLCESVKQWRNGEVPAKFDAGPLLAELFPQAAFAEWIMKLAALAARGKGSE